MDPLRNHDLPADVEAAIDALLEAADGPARSRTLARLSASQPFPGPEEAAWNAALVDLMRVVDEADDAAPETGAQGPSRD